MEGDLKCRKPKNDGKAKSNKILAKQNTTKKLQNLPLPRFIGQRLLVRITLVIGALVYAWYCSKPGKETVLANQSTMYQGRGMHVTCDDDYLKEITNFAGCIPRKCGRFVNDLIVTNYEADTLLWLAKRGMSYSITKGGATIMDLHSGALTYNDSFINFYQNPKVNFVTATDLKIYQLVREKIQAFIAESFGLDPSSLALTYPTFFSRLTSKKPISVHDEYWHSHVDKHTYESFHYTSLLYLNDYTKDFEGGRFVYVDKQANVTVEPRKGRVSTFTSGAENRHYVEKVTKGERYAITISFTCDQSKKIKDPALQ